MSKYRSPFTQKCHQTTPFKKKGNWSAGYHTGEDWVADGDRTLVAPTSGTVSYVSGSGSYGNHLIIHTDDGNCILMAHMASLPCVKKGQRVKAGDKVGVEGSTGNSTGLHLHIEVEKGTDWNYNKNLLKPSDYIDFGNFGTSTNATSGGNFEMKAYKNGSTKEYVYKTVADCKSQKTANSIGYLNPWESCECYGKIDGVYLVVYTAGSTKKTGFVKYAGGVK